MGEMFKNAAELVSFAKEGNEKLPIVLLDETWPSAAQAALGDDIQLFSSSELNMLVDFIRKVFPTKH